MKSVNFKAASVFFFFCKNETENVLVEWHRHHFVPRLGPAEEKVHKRTIIS